MTRPASSRLHSFLRTHGLGLLAGLQADLGKGTTQSGGDAGEVEPVGTLKDLGPVEVFGHGLGNGGTCPVVDHLGSSLRSALLHKIQAQALPAPHDGTGIHAKAAQLINGALADLMGGKLGNECRVHAIVGQGHRHVGLTAGISCLKLFRLDKPEIALRIQAHHNLTKGNNSFHGSNPF